MLFQMLAGVLPFRGDSMAELMYKIANEEAPDIRVIRGELPENLANLVTLSLSKRPETRYQNGDLFAQDLKAIMAESYGDFVASRTGDLRPDNSRPASVSMPLNPVDVFQKAALNPAVAPVVVKPVQSGNVPDIEI
jgi:serine/threonine protein kinase